MKSSEILMEAAAYVEAGGLGLYSACNYHTAEEGEACSEFIAAILDPVSEYGMHAFSPASLSRDIRATVLCLAAAIAEDAGD